MLNFLKHILFFSPYTAGVGTLFVERERERERERVRVSVSVSRHTFNILYIKENFSELLYCNIVLYNVVAFLFGYREQRTEKKF
jgi:hypothetical protein